jgi:hypothetical protein
MATASSRASPDGSGGGGTLRRPPARRGPVSGALRSAGCAASPAPGAAGRRARFGASSPRLGPSCDARMRGLAPFAARSGRSASVRPALARLGFASPPWLLGFVLVRVRVAWVRAAFFGASARVPSPAPRFFVAKSGCLLAAFAAALP